MAAVLPKFPIDKYKISEPLGQGAFGNVISYTLHQTDDTLPDIVAMKIFQPRNVSNFYKEKDIMEALMANHHPNIVRCFGICQLARRQHALVYEVFDIDLMEYMLKKDTYISNLETKNILYPIANALEHMKKVKTVHRDVKPENVLLKLSDGETKVL